MSSEINRIYALSRDLRSGHVIVYDIMHCTSSKLKDANSYYYETTYHS